MNGYVQGQRHLHMKPDVFKKGWMRGRLYECWKESVYMSLKHGRAFAMKSELV